MRVPRIYHPGPITAGQVLSLDDDASAHVGRVLRMSSGEQISLFNGDGKDYPATIISAGKKAVDVHVLSAMDNPSESPGSAPRASDLPRRSHGLHLTKIGRVGG